MARVGWLDGRITIHSERGGGGTLSSLVLKSEGISTFRKYLKNKFHTINVREKDLTLKNGFIFQI